MTDPASVAAAVRREVGRVLIGNEDTVDRLTVALLTRGHVLLEGVPGVAKTTMANLLARTTGLDFNRVQMTPDVLPADVTGTNIYRENIGEFQVQKGPVFANVVVADEINRATPKTQSALLEAMQERTVTIEGQTMALPDPFFVVATQNPIEFEGSLHPDESVYINDELWNAGEALEHAKENGTLLHETSDSRIYDADFGTLTLPETGELERTDCYLYEKEYEGEVYEIETKTGRQVSVSGNHPFLVNRDGVIQWVTAEDLDERDHLVSPSKLPAESDEFRSHETVLDELADEYLFVDGETVQTLGERLSAGETLSREELNKLRVACGWSKKDLAAEVDASYDQILNYLSGCESPVEGEIRDALAEQEIPHTNHFESHSTHQFDGELTDEEAGFVCGFILSDGSLNDTRAFIAQKTLSDRFDRWVSLIEGLGLDVRVSKAKGGRRATVDSKPFVDYLKSRYHLDTPERLLHAPKSFRRAFLEIFLLAESHYDAERKRITFVQKDRETTNLIAHLLLQFDIRPWITETNRDYRIKIQGNDLATYLNEFDWRGNPPEVDSFEGSQRTIPLPGEELERLVDLLGVRFDGDMSDQEWYNAYSAAQNTGVATSERLTESFIAAMEERVSERKERLEQIPSVVENDVEAIAKQCGLSITHIVEGTDLSRHRVWQAYEGEKPPEQAVEFVAESYTDRVQEAASLTEYLRSLVDGDVFYDPVVDIESAEYQGPVIGLSVPETHNYLAGLGSCGINHNTFELPEAQRDRFQQKLIVDLPDRETEAAILDRFDRDPDLGPGAVGQVVDAEDLRAAREAVTDVHVSDPVKEYILDLVAASRESPDTEHGASPRASLAFLDAGKAQAAIEGREYVIPDDIKALAEPIMAHRIVLSTDAELSDVTARKVVRDVVDSVAPPSAEGMLEEAEGGEAAVGDGGQELDEE